MQLCREWTKTFNINGTVVLVFMQRQQDHDGKRVSVITFMTDLLKYNSGSIMFYVTVDGWLTQREFDEQTAPEKVKAAYFDMVNQYNEQMKKGANAPVKLDIN